MTIFWKITNWIVLAGLGTICALGTFYKHIAFGWGLGDLVWYAFMYGLFISHLILTIISRKKGIARHVILTIVFLLLTIYICLQATIWRDSEYRWNGEIFYGSPYYSESPKPVSKEEFDTYVKQQLAKEEKLTIQSGDIVFQNSQSSQCKAIELATHSAFTHCGIIFLKDTETYVLEAVQPVRYTLLEDWIERGLDKYYVVKRLKDQSILSDSLLKVMQQTGEKFLNKDYDIYFGWGNDKIYCSELVWKIYKDAAGIEVGKLHKLKDFDLTSTEVKRIMKERYGNNIPYKEDVISPSNIFDSELLETIVE